MRYLLLTFYRKPNGQIDEQARFVKRCRNSDLVNSNIILDYGKKNVDKCVVEGKRLDKTFDDLNNYYKKIYPKMVEILEKEGPNLVRDKS
jgi:hypothetical protein